MRCNRAIAWVVSVVNASPPTDSKELTLRKLIFSISLIAGMLLGLSSTIASPGPNGKNNHGLCTAYFNGSQNGMDNKRSNGRAFIELARQAPDGPSDSDDTGGSVSDVWDWCTNPANNPKGIGGNPTNPTDPNSTPPGGGGGATGQSSAKGGKK